MGQTDDERYYDVDIFSDIGRRIPLTIQLRSSHEDDGILPRLVLSRQFAERIWLVFQDLSDCIVLFLCLMALISLFTASDDDDLTSELQSARHDLTLLLAESVQRYTEVSSSAATFSPQQQ